MAMTRDAIPVGLERGDGLDTIDVMLYLYTIHHERYRNKRVVLGRPT